MLNYLNFMDFFLVVQVPYRAGILQLWADELMYVISFISNLQLQRLCRRRLRVWFALHQRCADPENLHLWIIRIRSFGYADDAHPLEFSLLGT